MGSETGKPQPYERAGFHLFRPVPTRWADVDIYGHVNNVAYLSYFDSAVNSWYVEEGLLDPHHGADVFLVVETSCQYFRELRFPESVEVGIRVERLGTSSVRYAIAVFSDGRQEASAQGTFVHVLVDRLARTPVPITGKRRETLQAIALQPPPA